MREKGLVVGERMIQKTKSETLGGEARLGGEHKPWVRSIVQSPGCHSLTLGMAPPWTSVSLFAKGDENAS